MSLAQIDVQAAFKECEKLLKKYEFQSKQELSPEALEEDTKYLDIVLKTGESLEEHAMQSVLDLRKEINQRLKVVIKQYELQYKLESELHELLLETLEKYNKYFDLVEYKESLAIALKTGYILQENELQSAIDLAKNIRQKLETISIIERLSNQYSTIEANESASSISITKDEFNLVFAEFSDDHNLLEDKKITYDEIRQKYAFIKICTCIDDAETQNLIDQMKLLISKYNNIETCRDRIIEDSTQIVSTCEKSIKSAEEELKLVEFQGKLIAIGEEAKQEIADAIRTAKAPLQIVEEYGQAYPDALDLTIGKASATNSLPTQEQKPEVQPTP